MRNLDNKVRAIPKFSEFSDSEIQKLSRGVQYIAVEEGQKVFSAGDPADSTYVVLYGAIKLIKSVEKNKNVTLHFAIAGNFIGAMLMNLEGQQYPVDGVAMEDTGLLKIPREKFLENWMTNPTALQIIQQQVFQRVLGLHQDKCMFHSSVPQRLAEFLVRTLEQQPQHFGNRISVRLTRQEVAERVCTSVETVIRTFSEWTKAGIVNTDGQLIEVLKMEELLKLLPDRTKK